jgi:hypothetical protein
VDVGENREIGVEEKARWLIEEKWLLVGIRVEED